MARILRNFRLLSFAFATLLSSKCLHLAVLQFAKSRDLTPLLKWVYSLISILQAPIQGRWNGWIFTPLCLSPLLSFFFLSLKYSTRLWCYYIITKIHPPFHPPFQNPGSAPVLCHVFVPLPQFKYMIFHIFTCVKQIRKVYVLGCFISLGSF